MRCAAVALVIALSSSGTATAESLAVDEPVEHEVSTSRRVIAVAAAVIPGIFVRGLGSWIVGETRTAKRLLATAAIGVGAGAIGGAPIGLGGGSPYTTPGLPLVIVGGGLALTTWIADIAVAAGLERPGVARAVAPWSVELGTSWLHDAYRERALIRAAGTYELSRFGFGASTFVDPEGDSITVDGEIRVRILDRDGMRLGARTLIRRHRDDLDRVTLVTGEAEAVTRIELSRLDPVLAGQFVDLGLGLGIEHARYPNGESGNSSLLLGGFAWGAFIGNKGEVRLFYDHRRDSLAGGLAAWRAAGFVGSFGAALDFAVARNWSVRGELEVGNAYLSTFAIRYRGGL
ncbi:MAG TPA: hypothetical protein VIU61_19250 [Kofleriaceae bacterium]